MKYQISVPEYYLLSFEVEANSLEEALDKIESGREAPHDGNSTGDFAPREVWARYNNFKS